MDFKNDSSNDFPIPNHLEDMNKLFVELFDIRTSDQCDNIKYYSKYLELLRAAALKEAKQYDKTLAGKTYLEKLLALPIVNKHLYMGKLAFIKNHGPTTTYSIVEEWKNKLNEILNSDISISEPRNFKQVGR